MDDSDFTYDYFVCRRDRRDNKLFDMDAKAAVDLIFQVADNMDLDKDSADSNRESADANDYPDESDDSARGCGYGNDSSDEAIKCGDSDEVDEDEAARRFNHKNAVDRSAKESLLDRMRKQ